MSQLLNEIISAVLQIAVLTLIPYLFFLFRRDKSVSFLQYISLTSTTAKAIRLSILASLFFLAGALLITFINPEVRQIMTNPPSVTGKLRQLGPGPYSVIILLVIACFKTSLSEEIFFRGFIANRCIARFGFTTGNLVQSLIFGLLHVVLFVALASAGVAMALMIFFLSFAGAVIIGIIKEKHGNGSIIPGWVAHGLGNTIAYAVIAFVI